MNVKDLRTRLLATSVFAGALAGFAGPVALAQETDDDEARQETVFVTGTRIAKQDFVANSPITTVDSEALEYTGTVNTEDLLNSLPQLVPSFGRTSNNPGDGTARADLRGLGASRTLVLVDGQRMVPTTQTGIVDLNNIPPALIERVEVITGGASAVYGSDAVSGVVNFIMKKDFEGIEARAGFESTFEGDANFYTTDLTVGSNFDNDRGNIVLNMGYVSRESLFQGDRDFSTTTFTDNGQDVPGFDPFGSSGVPGAHVFGDNLFRNVDFSSIGYTAGTDNCTAPDGSVAEGLNASCVGDIVFEADGTPIPWINSGPNTTRYNYAPDNYLQLPQERYNATSLFSYDITENIEAYGRFSFASNQVPQQLAPTPAFTTVTTQLDNPFLTADAQALFTDRAQTTIDNNVADIAAQNAIIAAELAMANPDQAVIDAANAAIASANADIASVDVDGDGIPDQLPFFVGRRMVETGPRASNDDFFAFQFNAGLRGDLADTGIGYDVYFQTGRTQRNTDLEGDVAASRFIQAVNATDDGSGNAVCADTSNGCVAMNIFGPGNISPEAAAFVSADLNSKTEYNQIIAGASLNGDSSGLFELPGGPVGWAAGVEYREENTDFRASDALQRGDLLGFNSAPNLSGGFDVYDLYAEFYAPIIADAPFAKLLAVEAAFRYSDYSSVGETDSYKIGGEWAVNDQVRFRALFNTATRAPNIFELFNPQSNGFPGAVDPCSASQDPNGAGIAALCQATGVPNVGVYEQRNTQIEGIFGGNPNLDAETAETLTVGAVVSPDFIPGFTASLDYYTIEIEDYITSFGGGVANVLANCYDISAGGANETADPNNQFCSVINRGPGGEPLVFVTLQNVASLETSGFDIQANYVTEFDAIPGEFSFAYVGNVLDEWTFLADEIAEPNDCKGRFGSAFCDDPYFEYKHTATANWRHGPFGVNLIWDYLGEVEDEEDDVVYDVETIDGTSYFDLTGSWDVNDNLRFLVGIENLLDEEPPVLGDNQEQANTYPATYDPFGRTIFVSARLTF